VKGSPLEVEIEASELGFRPPDSSDDERREDSSDIDEETAVVDSKKGLWVTPSEFTDVRDGLPFEDRSEVGTTGDEGFLYISLEDSVMEICVTKVEFRLRVTRLVVEFEDDTSLTMMSHKPQ